MKRFLADRPSRVLAALVLAGLLATAAYGYWGGTGTGSAVTVLPDPQEISLSAGEPTAQLYPGGVASVEAVSHNPNPFFIHVSALELDVDGGEPFAADDEHGDCDVSALSFVTQDNGGAGWEIPPSVDDVDGTLRLSMPDAMRMSSAAENACQGATLTVSLVASE